MKTKITLTVLVLVAFFSINAQQKVKQKDLIGNWKLVIKVDEAIDEAKKENDDDALSNIILSSVSGLVGGLMDEIDIYMEFKKDGKVEIQIEAFGETETEYSEWSIDKEGRLFISDTDSFNMDDDDYWMMKDGVLINPDNESNQKFIYLVKVD